MDKGQLIKYYRCIVDCWRYFQKYSLPVDTEDFWKMVVDEGNELSRRYGDADFVCGIVGVIQQEIEGLCKRRCL